MAVTAFPYGSRLHLEVRWCDPLTQALVDPTGVISRIVGPHGGPVTTYTYPVDPELIRVSIGLFRTQADCAQVGQWTCRFEATGAYVGAGERKFSIRSSVFYP